MIIKNAPERRTYNFEIRAMMDGDVGILTGRPIVYNSRTDLGYFDEVIERGALNKTDLTDVRFLVNHDTSMIPLARSRRNNNGTNTMQFSIDENGMLLDWVKLDIENNADARALYSAVERGDISAMSFMFTINTERWEDLDTEHPTRYITDIGAVFEVSAVTFPAYEDTSISARGENAPEGALAALERAKLAFKPVDTGDKNELEMLKIKTNLLGGF